MGVDESCGKEDYDDMMDMNVSLNREELQVASAALKLSKLCMTVLKVSIPASCTLIPTLRPDSNTAP